MSSICWFRKGMRLHDNPALSTAIEKDLQLLPVFVLDPWFVANARIGSNRWRFLQQSLADLDKSLRKIGSRLLVLRGTPEKVFPVFFHNFSVKKISWEYDTEPYAKMRDKTIEELAKLCNVKVNIQHGHTLYNPDRVIEANHNKTPLTYVSMQNVISKLGPPSKPFDTITSLPVSSKMKLDLVENSDYNVPSLQDLGIEDESSLHPCLYPGGESEALERLNKYMQKKAWVRSFEKPKTSPNSLVPSTTVLSPYMKFGCLSARTFYHELFKVYHGAKHTQPPVSLYGQLLWREFFYTVAAHTPNFDRMEGNPICKQIPWNKDQKLLDAWTHAQTGYPFIDALMTQLRQEGWIHHLGRHAVACFLTRGDLWQSWEEGMKVFEELLLDADWSLNAGNWMWLSASAFFHQYFRVYSPITFGKHTDKYGEYIRKYVPVLRKYPEKYIYEPWKAPLVDQKNAGCIIGKDYPRPIVDHDEARKRNLEAMGKAYRADKEKRAHDDENDAAHRSKKKK